MRALTGIAVAVVLGVTMGAAPAPATLQQEPDPLKFDRSGRMLLVYQVAAADASGFAATWSTIKDQLTKMNDPGLAAFAKTFQIQRVETEAGADAIFVFDLNPVSTTYSYHPVTLLFETLKEQPDVPGVGFSYDRATELFAHVQKASAATWWLNPVGQPGS